MKIKMLKTVRAPLGPRGSVLMRGWEYRAEETNGSVFGVCKNGYKILLQDGEWEEVSS